MIIIAVFDVKLTVLERKIYVLERKLLDLALEERRFAIFGTSFSKFDVVFFLKRAKGFCENSLSAKIEALGRGKGATTF